MNIFINNYGDLRLVWIMVLIITVVIALVSVIAWASDDRCKRMYGQDFEYSPTFNASCVNHKGEIRAY